VAQVDNEKFGATIMIACEYRTSTILPPMIIFPGVYCTKLMRHWANYDRVNVILNKSHWMTSNTAIIYISFLMNIFNGKKIGLIWDKHSLHRSYEVLQFIMECNDQETTNSTKIITETVDEGLTPIIQVPDVADKGFKEGLKKCYHQYHSSLRVTIGEKITVTREQLVDFVLDTIEQINQQNDDHQFIADPSNNVD
jgi:hypothetical protein